MAVEGLPSLDLLELLVKAHLLVDVFLVEADEDGSSENCVKKQDGAWESSDHAHASLGEGESAHDGKREAYEVRLDHVHSDARFQEVLQESNKIESEKDVADEFTVVSADQVHVNLGEDQYDGDDLEEELALLVEGVLAPALHGESLDDVEGDLVVVLREAQGEVWVGEEWDDHAEEEEVIALQKGHGSADGKHDWSEVNLDSIEVADVFEVEVAEHADHGVSEHNHGQALMVALLVLKHLSEQAGEREEEHREDNTERSNGLVELLHIIKHIEFPSPKEHLLSHFILHDHLWKSAIVFFGIGSLIQNWCIGLLAMFVLKIDSIITKRILQDSCTHNGIKCIKSA